MSQSRESSRGFSLVEMMVALVAGLIVSAAVVAFMLSSMKSNGEYVQSTRLTQELRNTLDLAVRDISRAGANDFALHFVALPNTSPFAPTFIKDGAGAGAPEMGGVVTAGDVDTYVNADQDGCVLYAYDRSYPNNAAAEPLGDDDADEDGTPDPVSNDNRPGKLDQNNGEIRGIRRIVNADGVGVVEYAESSSTNLPNCDVDDDEGAIADYSSNPAACSATSGWCPLSDPTQLDVTRLLIIDKGVSLSGVMRVRNLGLFIEGRPRGSTEYTRAVSSDVKIRADCISTVVGNCFNAPVPDAP